MKNKSISLSKIAWETWCIASFIGIWPRHIEPRLLLTTHLSLKIPKLPKALEGLRILQFSDLHLNENCSDAFLKKLSQKIRKTKPDIIVFTGDFLCSSKLDNPKRLRDLLCTLSAPFGCYAVLGNHDYQDYVSIAPNGNYDVMDKNAVTMRKGWRRLFKTPILTGKVTSQASRVPLKQDLVDLINETPFKLLHNKTTLVPIKDTFLNICGLGEYVLGRCQPDIAFSDYVNKYPGIILAHNPDSVPILERYPGDIILCGHTHGAQINIPGLWKKFTLSENYHLKRGLIQIGGKWVNINRGVGAVMPFRWFSVPELSLMTLKGVT